MKDNNFNSLFDELAKISSEIICPYFRNDPVTDDKSHGKIFDPVTEADKQSEFAMRARIKQVFPDHGLYGEEYGIENPDADYVWVLDPIDGTKSFISGSPLWGTLVGLLHKGFPVYGMMNQPFTREIFIGDGKMATWRGPDHNGALYTRSLKTRACADLSKATLMTTSLNLIPEAQRPAYLRVESEVRLTRYGGDCYAYCQLALGGVDLVIEANLKPYDICGLIPVVEGAGGIITNWQGGPAAKGGTIIAAGDARIHAAALELLNG